MAEKCVRCGICQSVCPIFAELKQESAVARGKVSLIKKLFLNETRYSQRLSTYLLQCLGCGACSETCPNEVRADELILALRALMVEKKGLSIRKALIFRKILNSVYLLPMIFRAGSLLRGLILKKVPKENGLRLRFDLPYLDKTRFIPSIATPFFLNRYSSGIEVKNEQMKVGLFAGCSINYLFPSIGESTVRLLCQSHFSVAIPREQTCCGLLPYGSGDIKTAASLARRNIKAFARLNIDHIIAPCASCFYFLKEGYMKLFPGDEEVRSFSEKIVEPSRFFLNLLDFYRDNNLLNQNLKLRLTYHDPCHLRRRMKIYQEPRRLLQSLPGIELVEMEQPNRCCGMGGSFNFLCYELSKNILQFKLKDIETTKVESVTTSCMGCMIQLKDGVYQKKLGISVVHLVEVLDKAITSPVPSCTADIFHCKKSL
jgi:glycolate oxidase iron-sulfur subunit